MKTEKHKMVQIIEQPSLDLNTDKSFLLFGLIDQS